MNSIEKSIINNGYYKSRHKLPEYEGIFISSTSFTNFNNKHETLTDSFGKKHVVVTSCEITGEFFKDEDFHPCSGYLVNTKYKSTLFGFQYNLKSYLIINSFLDSAYQECYDILDKRLKWNYYKRNCYELRNLDYTPIYETVFFSGNGSIIENYIPDALFFKQKDKELALKRIDPKSREQFIKVGYKDMNEDQVIRFMTKRIVKKAKYIDFYNALFNLKLKRHETS